jgi:hypothetical protein
MQAGRQQRADFPGNDSLLGIGSPSRAVGQTDPSTWLKCVTGSVVEMTCHPGLEDRTLLGRDARDFSDLQRRVQEWQGLRSCALWDACRLAGFRLAAPSEFVHGREGLLRHAA